MAPVAPVAGAWTPLRFKAKQDSWPTTITDEQARVANTPSAAMAAQRGDSVDRKLRVRLQGVAPTDTDVANFLSGITNVPFFEQVAMTYSRDRSDSGHVMREFEITFCLAGRPCPALLSLRLDGRRWQ